MNTDIPGDLKPQNLHWSVALMFELFNMENGAQFHEDSIMRTW